MERGTRWRWIGRTGRGFREWVKRLAGQGGLLRVRVGEWRIVYEVREREVVVLVVRIGARGEV